MSAGLQPCHGSLNARDNALSTAVSSPVRLSTAAPRNTDILTATLSVLTHRTDGVVLLIKCMLLDALKKTRMQNYEGRLV